MESIQTMNKLYQQKILRAYHYPANKGRLTKPAQTYHGVNPFCGDEIVIDITLDADKRIADIGWEGSGCVISQAAASFFSEMAKGKTLAQIQKMDSGKLLGKLGMELSPTRMKCALLALYTLKGQGGSEEIR